MPPYFLTVRLPYMLLGPDAADDRDRLLDPTLTHEKKASVFYEVDSQDVAQKLLDVFRSGNPGPGIPGDPLEPVGSPERLRDLVYGLCQPVYDLVDAADMALPERVRCRGDLELLERMAECDGDPGIRADLGLPNDRRSVLLWYRYEQARDWERLLREELGIADDAQEGDTSARGPAPGAVGGGPGSQASSGFRKEAGGWSIWFNDGERFVLADKLIGFRCLAHLIRNQGKTFTHQEIIEQTRDHAPVRLVTELEEAEHGLSFSGALPDTAYDHAGQREIEEYIKEQEDLADATDDPAKKAEHREQAELARKRLQKDTDRWGRPRKIGDPAETARKRVSQAIDRAIAAIGRGDGALAQHLRDEMSRTTYRSYSPTPSVPWETSA